jgi:hypothetical protein
MNRAAMAHQILPRRDKLLDRRLDVVEIDIGKKAVDTGIDDTGSANGAANALYRWSASARPAFHPTDAAFKSLYQRQSPPSGNAILRGRDKGPETVPAIQSADCRDKMCAQIAASSGRFALIREIPICAGLRGGAERTRTSNQAVMSRHRGLEGLELATKRLSAASSEH